MTNDLSINNFNLVSNEDKKAFIDYYNDKMIIPVTQDINDNDFIFKRNSLYKLLGIPLQSLNKRNILELGPGGGFNATAITNYEPSSYVFVDAAKASLIELHRKAQSGLFGSVNVEIINSNIFDYYDARTFDLVIIEGVIPGQTKPYEMLKHASSFVSKNGNIVTTTTTASSLLADVCRRIYRPLILNQSPSFEEQVSLAVKVFDSHLRKLGTITRPPRDWVLDNILHKWEKNACVIFTMLDTSNTLGSAFDFYGSSPRFLIDDRFYKKIGRSASTSNDLLNQQFGRLTLALLDYRISFLDIICINQSKDIENLCTELFNLHIEIIDTNCYNKLDDFIYCMKLIRKILTEVSVTTALSIDDFIINFPKIVDTNIFTDLVEFSKWWGRGQQYTSFTRIE